MTLTHVDLVSAASFAAQRHAAQTRKGDAGEPYINHLIEVTEILAGTAAHIDIPLLMAGLLHDTVEDTDTTIDELTSAFGADVAGLVMEATDDKSLKKADRKRLQVETAPRKSTRARLLKTADKISNLRAIASSPPAGWEPPRMTEYVEWSQSVVSGCLNSPAGFTVAHEIAAAAALQGLFGIAVADAKHEIAKRWTT